MSYEYKCDSCKYNDTDENTSPCGWCGDNLNYEPKEGSKVKIVIETTEYISKQLHDGTMSDTDFEKLYKQARNHIVLSDGYEPQERSDKE